jgi:hypothetical protein
VIGLILFASSAVGAAGATPVAAGDYLVELEQIANDCPNGGLHLGKQTLTIEQRGRSTKIKVLLPPTAIMRGSIDKAGKIKARARRGGTAIQGMLGEFNVAGTVERGKIELVLVGQYYASGRPYCVQSWNLEGARK